MLFDPADPPLTLAEAAAALPRLNGRKLHMATVWRWARVGVRGVRLEVRLVGGRMVTTRGALEAFTMAVADQGIVTAHRGRPPRPRRAASALERADAEAAREGL
ncbi:MAG: DUF1580 domain-containing protein [Planctomycetota bacterium]|nr:DUF1580 domain-containing protein [Planctomycetota bacterium]